HSYVELSSESLSYDELSVEYSIYSLAPDIHLFFRDIRTAYICAFFLIGTFLITHFKVTLHPF
ncbi:hypothetical protein J7E55_19310, partial [Bacillus sp. ISL-53]|nr:hypothetical protein [Bacillus sp. ISL-53]